ncbi:MAG TPA: hypothetical protein PK358_01950 [Spirochaetota bacterium]|nr:hypothetical protein [Spirochaetota bacterium]HPJ33567.1 hypothetical protein [Spirochaetota bacterium]
MKKILLTVLIFSSVQLFPADLVNRDSRGYQIEVRMGGTTHSSISGNTTQMGGAPDGAFIRIKETGSCIKVEGGNDVIINNGKLSQ